MAFLGVKVPLQFANLLSEIDIPAENKTSPDKMHITLAYFGYLGQDIPDFDAAKTEKITREVLNKNDYKPLLVSTKEITTFSLSNGANAIVALVASEKLHQLQNDLALAFDKNQIIFSKDFDFNPHITLGYSKSSKNATINEIDFKVHDIVLWIKNHNDIYFTL